MGQQRPAPITQAMMTGEEKLEQRLGIHKERLAPGRERGAAGRVDYLTSGSLTDQEIKEGVTRAALAELRPKLESGEATREDLIKLIRFKYSSAKTQRWASGEAGLTALKKASEKGAFLNLEAAELPEKQQLAVKGMKTYLPTPNQTHSQMMQDGSVPKELLPVFGSVSPEDILTSAKIPDGLKDIFRSKLEVKQFGPPSMRGGPSEGKNVIADWAKSAGIGFLDVIGSGGRFINGATAGYLKALQESDVADEIRKKGGKQIIGIPELMMPMTKLTEVHPAIMVAGPPGLGAATALGMWSDDFMETLIEDPSTAGRTMLAHGVASLNAVVHGAKGIVEPWVDVGDREDIGRLFAETMVHYKKESAQLAIQSREPGDTPAIVAARAKNIYASLMENDIGEIALEHPMASAIALEIVGDPLNFAGAPIVKGIGAIVKGTWSLSKEIPIAGQLPKILGIAGTKLKESEAVAGLKRGFIAAPWDTKEWSVMGEAALKALPHSTRGQLWRAFMAARDRGGAAGMKIAGLGNRIDARLSKLKETEIEHAFELMEMNKVGRSQVEIELEIARRIQDPKRQKVVGKILEDVSRLGDQVFKEMASWGQLNDIRKVVDAATGKATGHAVVRATYLENYVPHKMYEGVGDLTEKLNKAGFRDVESAHIAILLNRAKETLKVAPEARKGLVETEIARLEEMLASAGGSGANMATLLSDDYIKTRALLYKLGKARADPDIIGQTRAHRIKSAGGAEKARLGAPGVIKDLRLQWAAHIKGERAAAVRSAEIDELFNWAGKSQTMKALTGGSAVKTVNLGRRVTAKDIDDARQHAATLSDQLGVEFGVLDLELGRRFAQVTGQTGDPYRAIQIMPKMMAGRINEVFPRIASGAVATTSRNVAVEQALGVVKGFHDYFVKPSNALWRPTKTVLRSLAFHATNTAGAVGLGVLAHGMRAFNWDLQGGAARVALNSAFTGTGSSKLASRTLKLDSGQKIALGEIQDTMAKYNIIGQSGLRYGHDIAGGKGPIQWAAGWVQKVAVKSKAQHMAAFGDDYQHAVAFMGWVKRNAKLKNGKLTDDDLYRAIDFTTEYAGNYGRLTAFEKTALRDVFAFYSWNRFIMPHLVKQITKHPGRLAAFEKFQKAGQAYIYETGGGRPVPATGIPDFMQLAGATIAPESMQPDIEPGQPGSHQLAVMVIETPNAALSGLAPGYGGQSPITAQYGPVGLVTAWALNGFDPTTTARGSAYGSKMWLGLPSIKDVAHNFKSPEDYMTALGNVADSRIGQHAIGVVPLGEALVNLTRMYVREGMYDEAAELHMRYRAGRDWMGLDHLVAAGAGLVGHGFKPLSLGSWIPGAKMYPVDPYQVAARRKSRAMAELPKNILD